MIVKIVSQEEKQLSGSKNWITLVICEISPRLDVTTIIVRFAAISSEV